MASSKQIQGTGENIVKNIAKNDESGIMTKLCLNATKSVYAASSIGNGYPKVKHKCILSLKRNAP